MLRRLVYDHPFLANLLVTLCVATIGLVRVEYIARTEAAQNEALIAANDGLIRRVAQLSTRGDREQAARIREDCQQRNVSLYRHRRAMRRLVEALAEDSGGDRRTLAIRQLVPAENGDADCDEDGEITAADYGRENGS